MSNVETQLNYFFKNKSLLQQSLTHRSYANESNKEETNNEKLEFLGDAVLDLVMAELLIESFPTEQEGVLSKYRAYLVNETALASRAMSLSLQNFLKLGKSERVSQGEMKPRLLASGLEAIIGAVYLDGGLTPAKTFVKQLFKLEIKNLQREDKVLDYKTELQEIVQSHFKKTPTYDIIQEEGPSHDRIFTAALKVGEEVVARGTGKSKKLAEQNAAQIYFEQLSQTMKQES